MLHGRKDRLHKNVCKVNILLLALSLLFKRELKDTAGHVISQHGRTQWVDLLHVFNFFLTSFLFPQIGCEF